MIHHYHVQMSTPVKIRCNNINSVTVTVSVQSHLKHTDQGLREVVKVTAPGPVVREVEFPSKNLHAQE